MHIVEVPNLARFTVSADGMVGKPKLLVRPAFAIAGELKHYHYLDNMLRERACWRGLKRAYHRPTQQPVETYHQDCSGSNTFAKR